MNTPFVPNPANQQTRELQGQKITFELFKLLDEYDNKLKEPSEPWNFQTPQGDLQYIVISMIETMIRNGGIGLSAIQVGLPYNIFVMGAGQQVFVITNPVIVEQSEEKVIMPEGCLSAPGLFLEIKRPAKVKVAFCDMKGEAQEMDLEGLTARIFLHEYDHLQGILFKKLVSPIKLQKGKEKVAMNLRRMKAMREEAMKKALKEQAEAKTGSAPQKSGVSASAAPVNKSPIAAGSILKFDTGGTSGVLEKVGPPPAPPTNLNVSLDPNPVVEVTAK